MINFTDELINKIEKDFAESELLAAGRKSELFDALERCTETEKYCLEFLFAYLPMSDLTNYSGELFYNHVHSCVSNFEKVSWKNDVDTVTFLNYILVPRINNENLEHYNQIIFNDLFPRIKGMTLKQAVIEANIWCFEKATYCGSDIRTVSPLTMIRNTNGRCGEESTFVTAALRSVCIPARQCYVPRWCSGDSNHAWVEVLVDGEWHFMGACEPDVGLDRGWFPGGASRAMLTDSRIFSDIVSKEDRFATLTKRMKELNTLDLYADTEDVTIRTTLDGKPLEGVSVKLCIVNFNELYPLFDLVTDSYGEVRLLTGRGDFFATLEKDGKILYESLDIRKSTHYEFDMSSAVAAEELPERMSFDMTPADQHIKRQPMPVSEDYAKIHPDKVKKAEKLRTDYKATFYNEDSTPSLCEKYPEYASDIKEFLINSQGNSKRIEAFIDDPKNLTDKIAFLHTLSKKDFGDCDNLILEKHFAHQIRYKSDFADNKLFEKYVLAIRISNEWLSDYASPIDGYFDAATKVLFRSDPFEIMKFVEKTVKPSEEFDYDALVAEPYSLLLTKCGTAQSKTVLAAAICRSLGIPSRVMFYNKTAEYFIDGKWHSLYTGKVSESEYSATLELEFDDIPEIMRHISFGILDNNAFRTVYPMFGRRSEGTPGKNTVRFENDLPESVKLLPGTYRILSSFRLKNGGIQGLAYHVTLRDGETKKVHISLRTVTDGDSAEKPVVFNASVIDLDGKEYRISEIAGKNTVFAWLKTKLEPTEHLFNEMLAAEKKYQEIAGNIIFILKNRKEEEHITYKKIMKTFPDIKVFYSDSDNKEVFGSLKTQDTYLPLVVVTDGDLKARFVSTGYNIGIAEKILQNIL